MPHDASLDRATPPPPPVEGLDGDLSLDAQYDREWIRLQLGLVDQLAPVWVDEERRFRLLERRGRGNMGAVYLAFDESLKREVAVKVVASDRSVRAAAHQDRLLEEARSLAQVTHENVLRVLDSRRAATGEQYLALEYVDGRTLRAWQAEQSFRPIVRAYIDAARALDAAHRAGVVHRDFKPDNVLVETKTDHLRVVVVDFGLAAGARPDSAGSEGEDVERSQGLGTPGYMAPEQRIGRADARADQYAFCVSLFEALAGQRPFVGKRTSADELPPASPGMPGWLFAILRRGLELDPDRRYPSMAMVANRLERGLQWHRGSRIAASLLAVGVVAGFVSNQREASRCLDAGAEMDKSWSVSRQASVEQRLRSLDVPWANDVANHALSSLDQIARRWKSLAITACESSKSAPDPAVQLCLDTWLVQVDSMVAGLEVGDDQIARNILDVLEPLLAGGETCATPSPVLADPVRHDLARSVWAEASGDLEAARIAAEDAVKEAQTTHPCIEGARYSHDEAAARFQVAHVHGALEDHRTSLEQLSLAGAHAVACEAYPLLFDIWAYEAEMLAAIDPDRGAARLADAEALLVRIFGVEDQSLRRSDLWRAAGIIALARDDHSEARRRFQSGLSVLEQHDEDHVARKAKLLTNIGITYYAEDRHSEAADAYEAAVDVVGAAIGPDHPHTRTWAARVDLNLALAALESGDHARADALLRQVLASPEVEQKSLLRALIASIQAKGAAGELEGAAELAESVLRSIAGQPQLGTRIRAEALTIIGQTIADAALLDGDTRAFERGVAELVRARPLWSAEGDAFELAIVDYELARLLWQADELARAEQALARVLQNTEALANVEIREQAELLRVELAQASQPIEPTEPNQP
jgi:serine/threonine protein kinase